MQRRVLSIAVVLSVGCGATNPSEDGYSMFLDSASEGAAGVAIQVRSVLPGSGCAVTLAQTQLVDVARLPRRTGAVTFVKKHETLVCR